MLERIDAIKGIGLLHEVNGKPHALHKATLVYAHNARGKSTLASIFRSASSGTPDQIEERRTVDGAHEPSVILNFTNGISVQYQGKAWTKASPEIVVFDTAFIEENVHSGGAVSATHRKNLLQFALGKAAVTARMKEEDATKAASKAADLVRQTTAQLAGYHTGMPLQAFEKLTPIADADARIEALQKRQQAANGAIEIMKRAVPKEAPLPTLSITALFEILRTSLEDIENDAERLVRQHLSTSAEPGFENWISAGIKFDNSTHCPYCAQETGDVQLLRAYRTHFNAQYAKLKAQVSQLNRGLDTRLHEEVIATFQGHIDIAAAQAQAWFDLAPNTKPVFNKDMATELLLALKLHLKALADAKELDPIGRIGSDEDMAQANRLWDAIIHLMTMSNEQVRSSALAIETYKKTLAQDSPASIQTLIQNIQLAKRRQEPAVIDLLKKIEQDRKAEGEALAAKKAARNDLDALMANTLKAYQGTINALLKKFGATFEIEELDANFKGGSPRTEYLLKMRGKSVKLEGGTPRFSTALSDGDKRTLAFAFFVASNLSDPDLGKKILVIDDPMSSLDLNRRHHTKIVLRDLHAKADQLIVLAHDPYFVRDLRDELTPKDGQTKVAVLQLTPAGNGYTSISKITIDEECESQYIRHHRILKEYNEGAGAADSRTVAKAIRPFLEGYIHRRFPNLVPKDLTFGRAISFIKESPPPVAFAQSLTAELAELNDYAGQYHHDTNPDAEAIPVTPAELKSVCERALHLVYSGAPLA